MKQGKNGQKPKDDSGPQLIGYARVSTADQSMALQIKALEEAGCLNIWEEPAKSGAAKNRPQLDLAIKDLRPGDTLVVWRLDRLSRSIRDLYKRLDQITEQGASFKSLTEHFDFSTATGKLILGVIGLMAEFERQLTIERTKAGMEVLRAKGHTLGAPIKFNEAKRKLAAKMLSQKVRKRVRGETVWRKRYTQKAVAEALKISVQTLIVYLREKKLKVKR